MKSIILLCLAAFAVAEELEIIPIVSQNFEMSDDLLTYKQNFEAGNGIKMEENGQIKQFDPENAGTVSKGSYSYTAPDGTLIKVDWVADENGFRPSGAHLPVAPPMPDHVVQLLADLKAAGVL